MANGFAYLVLFAYLPFGIALFTILRPPLAATLVFLIAFMFLPEQTLLDLPGLPGIGKQEIASLACMFGVLLRARRRLWAAKPLRGPDLLIVLMFVGNFATAMTNQEVLTRGPTVLPALTTWEGMSMIMADTMLVLLPFLIGRALFTTAKDLRQLLLALAVGGALYTPLLFVELMMSPQLHNWIYGFAQHDFIQTMRGDGYRPMVFMPHGLAVGLFMAWATMAAVTLFKAKKSIVGLPAMLIGIYDLGFLVWCKSLGAAVYALTCAPLLMLLKPRAIARVCAVLAVIVLTYPVLRASGVFPEKQLVSIATTAAGPARAQSLQYRFDMETLLTNHASTKPFFGWGRFRRNMVFEEYTGRAISVSDGHWIVTYSVRGAWGFVCVFLLITLPLLVLRKRLKRVEARDERTMLAGLGLIVAFGAVDLLPNALQNVLMVFMCGALWGVAKALATPATVSPAGPDLPGAGPGGGGFRATATTNPMDEFGQPVPVPVPPQTARRGTEAAPPTPVPRAYRPSEEPPTGTRKKDPFE